jgi:hypothetical protein
MSLLDFSKTRLVDVVVPVSIQKNSAKYWLEGGV